MSIARATSASEPTSNRLQGDLELRVSRNSSTLGGGGRDAAAAGGTLAVRVQSALLRRRVSDCAPQRRLRRAAGRVHDPPRPPLARPVVCGDRAAGPAPTHGRLDDAPRAPAADHLRRPSALSTRRRSRRMLPLDVEVLPGRLTLVVPKEAVENACETASGCPATAVAAISLIPDIPVSHARKPRHHRKPSLRPRQPLAGHCRAVRDRERGADAVDRRAAEADRRRDWRCRWCSRRRSTRPIAPASTPTAARGWNGGWPSCGGSRNRPACR